MSKTFGAKDNFRVVITPRSLEDFGLVHVSRSFIYQGEKAQAHWEDDMTKRCMAIMEQIRRHVDDVSNANMEFDQKDICIHCGAYWTEKNGDYNGGCCDKDCDEEDARIALHQKSIAG